MAVRVSHTPLLQQAAAKFNECKNNAATPSVKHILRSSLTIEIQNHSASSQWRIKTSTFQFHAHSIEIGKILLPRWSCRKLSLVWTQCLLFSVPSILSHLAHTIGSKSLRPLQQMCAVIWKLSLPQLCATVSPRNQQPSHFCLKNKWVCFNPSGQKSLYNTHAKTKHRIRALAMTQNQAKLTIWGNDLSIV